MKYLVHDKNGVEEPFIFPETIEHVEMADLLGVENNVVSAGFFTITDRGASCYGSSMTLMVSARRIEDRDLINRLAGY
jgi:hypothetical protein